MTFSTFDNIYPLGSSLTTNNIALQTEQKRKAGFLNILTIALMVLLGVVLGVMFILPQITWYSFLIIGTGFGVNIFAFYLNQVGKTQFAAYVFCFNFFTFVAVYIPIFLLIRGDAKSAIPIGYVLSLSIIFAGMLIHPRAPFGFAILNTLVIVFFFSIAFETFDEITRTTLPILFFSYLLTIVSWSYQRSLAEAFQYLDQAHEKTQRSEAQYRQLIEVAQEGIWVIDADSKTVLVNPSMAEMLGYTVEDMLGKHLFDFMDKQGVEIATRDIERRQQGITEQHDFEFICKDGKRIYTTIETAPLSDDAGTYTGAIAGVINITERKLAEQALRESEDHFRQLSELMIDYAFSFKNTEDKGFVLDWDVGSLQTITGYEPHELIVNRQISVSLFHPDDRKRLNDDFIAIEDHGQSIVNEYRIVRKNGEIRWVQIRCEPMWDEAQEHVTRYYGISHDITEHKHAEITLQKNEEWYRQISELLSDNAFSHKYDLASGQYILENFIGKILSGYMLTDFVDRESQKNIHPNDAEEVQSHILATQQGKATESEYRIITIDGDIRWVYCKREAIWDEELGRVIRYFSVTHDITERKLAEEALRQNEERYRVISELLSDSAFSIKVLENGMSESEWKIGTLTVVPTVDWFANDQIRFVHPDDRKRIQSDAAAVRQGTPTHGEYRLLDKEGQTHWVYINRVPIWDEEQQRVIRYYGTAQDITARKSSEEKIRHLNEELEERVRLRTIELENANRELDAFAYSVSHDLRAPLRAITGFSQAILEDYEDLLDEAGQDFLNDIVKSGKRMNDLIQDLLHLSRITRSDLHPREVNISDIVQSILDELQKQNSQRQVTVSVEKNVKAYVDERLLRVALGNLLGNAWKFTGKTDKAQIDFFIMEEDGITVYVVKDNGAGFDMTYADKLFGAFQRLHHDDEFEGTGIGLATVQRVIHKHRGRIWSDAIIGQGATFYFTLPVRM